MARERATPRAGRKKASTGDTVTVDRGGRGARKKKGSGGGKKSSRKPSTSSRIGEVSSSNLKRVEIGGKTSRPKMKGLGLSTKMMIVFGLLIAVITFSAVTLMASRVESNVKSEITKSGVNSVNFLGSIYKVIDKNGKMLSTTTINNWEKELDDFYKGEAKKFATESPEILSISLRDPVNKMQQKLFSSKSDYSENSFVPVQTDYKDIKVSDGFLKFGSRKVRAFKFVKTVTDGENELGDAIVYLSAKQIVKATDAIQNMGYIISFAAAIVGVLISILLSQKITSPIRKLTGDIQIVADEGDLDHKAKESYSDEIGVLAKAFNSMTHSLKRQQDLEVEAERRDVELKHASDIQARLLPSKIPNIKGLDIHTVYQSAKEVGGDYYDILKVDDSHIAFVVADVSGKGIPGSMVMTETRTILQIIRTKNMSSKDVMSKANMIIARDIKPGMFVTMMYCILDLRKRKMLVSSAGHNPLLIHRATGELLKINPKGIALGFDKGRIFDKVIAEEEVQLHPGDRVLLYTDGVVESMSPSREEYGDDRLDVFTEKFSDLTSVEFVTKLMHDLKRHQGSAEQHDDITILTFKV